MLRVTVIGADKVARDLRGLADDLAGDDLAGSTEKLAKLAARHMASFAPRRTGRLAGSFRVAGSTAGSPLVYAPVQNFGWRRHGIAATRFAQRAAEQTEIAAPRIVEAALSDDIRRRHL